MAVIINKVENGYIIEAETGVFVVADKPGLFSILNDIVDMAPAPPPADQIPGGPPATLPELPTKREDL